MALVFDPLKDAGNIEKHGVSLSLALELEIVAVLPDTRKAYGEVRFRAFGYIDGVAHCLAFTYRGDDIRPISLRRAHAKEMKRHER
jgi:uncharacterized protein